MSEPPRELSENEKWALEDERTRDFAVLLLANRGKALDDSTLAKLLDALEEVKRRFRAALAVEGQYATARAVALRRISKRDDDAP
jgi:hypothetical protein